MAVFSNLHFHKSFHNQSLRLVVISYLSQEWPCNFFNFVSKLSELIFESTDFYWDFYQIWSCKRDRVGDLLLTPSCLIMAQLIYGPEMSYLLWEKKAIPTPGSFLIFLVRMYVSTVILGTDNSSYLINLFSS